jgi:hypothetical protein
MSRGLPSTAGAAALEGTEVHELAAQVLRGVNPYSLNAPDPYVDAVLFYQNELMDDFLESPAFKLPGSIEQYGKIEFPVDLRPHVPGVYGTLDFGAMDVPQRLLRIYDLKYGVTPVYAEANPQLLIYAIGMMLNFPQFIFEEVELNIIQPRAKTKTTRHRRWRCSAFDLLDFQADLIRHVAATQSPSSPLLAGDWCWFCPARLNCPALRAKKHDKAKNIFAEEDEFEKLF